MSDDDGFLDWSGGWVDGEPRGRKQEELSSSLKLQQWEVGRILRVIDRQGGGLSKR